MACAASYGYSILLTKNACCINFYDAVEELDIEIDLDSTYCMFWEIQF